MDFSIFHDLTIYEIDIHGTDLVRTKDNLNNRQKCYGVWFIVIPCDSGKEKRSEKSSTIKCLLNLLFFN